MVFDLWIYDLLLTIVIGLYGVVAFVAFLATASERQSARVRQLWPRLLSVLACLVWPLVVGAMVLWQRKDTDH